MTNNLNKSLRKYIRKLNLIAKLGKIRFIETNESIDNKIFEMRIKVDLK